VLFSGFSDRDFDAYLESKWQSNVFNRERLEVKEKLLALGRMVSPRLQAADGSLLLCEVSAEHPAIWNQHRVPSQCLFFSRNLETRRELDTIIDGKRPMASLIDDPSPLRNHIFLSVLIDRFEVELGLKLHSDASVDRENLQRKCQDYFLREKLLHLIRALPDGFKVGISGKAEHPCPQLDDETLQKLIVELPGAGSWLQLRRSIPRDDLRLREPAFVDLCRDVLGGALLPVMIFVAWSRDNDFLSMRETLKKKEVEQRSKGLTKNDQVRVMKGPFSGRTGRVQEIDSKGAVKVLLGTVAVKLASADLTKI
jgi:transcription antitermination factor NusG